jgi:ketosteroid isomerase-like protein
MQLKFTSLFSGFILCIGNIVSAQQNDSTLIVQLLKDDYATLGTRDTSAHLRNVTNDFFLIEGGQIWDIETELDSLYRRVSKRTIIRSNYFTIKTVKVSGDMAYAIWNLRTEFKENGKLVREKVWNESGVFRRQKSAWKIAFLHSSLEPHK